MTSSAVRSDFDQTFDIQVHFAAKVTFNRYIFVDSRSEFVDFRFGQIFNARVRIDIEVLEQLLCCRASNTVNVSQADFYSLIAGKVDTGNSSHK